MCKVIAIFDMYDIVSSCYILLQRTMNHEVFEQISLQNILKNGDIISQQQFTELILQQERVNSLTLLTMAYIAPRGDGGSVAKIHKHLLKLADQGTSIYVGIDNSYAHLIAPHSDFPNKLAPLFMDRRDIKAEELRRARLYEDLANHPNIDLVFHGEGRLRFLPFSKFDHRKILCVEGSPIQDFAVIYGFNMDKTLDHDVDSGIYITDPKALEWIDTQTRRKDSLPEKATFADLAFITRETTRKGDRLADQEISSIIQGAESNLLFCGQFIPDGQILKDLVDTADRGAEVTIISNGPSPSRQPLYMPIRKLAERKLARVCRARENMKFYIPEDPSTFVHMKALIADIDKPLKARAITGTDNMVNPMLRRFKTREILVELLNYNYIINLYEYIRNNVFSGVKRVQFS